MLLKILLILGVVGHLTCWWCDCLLAYTPNGRFSFSDTDNNEKMSAIFKGYPLKRAEKSMILGIFSLMTAFWGYFGLYLYTLKYSKPYAVIMIISSAVFFVLIAANHIMCGMVEWLYVKLGRTEEARSSALGLFKTNLPVLAASYTALLVFSVSFFIAVISGALPLSRWCCVFNILPIFLLLSPFKVPGAGNMASALMFAGLIFVI